MIYNHVKFELENDIKSTDTDHGRFYVAPGGMYPSITTILSDTTKQAIIDWREWLGDVAADAELKRASCRGTAVHDMIEKRLNNHPNPTELHDLAHIKEYNSVRLLLNNISDIVCQEAALWSDTLRVAGRVDCIGLYKGKLSIIDFKTSRNDKTSNLIDNYWKQTAAYSLMFQEQYGVNIQNLVIIMSTERGIAPLVFQNTRNNVVHETIKTILNYHKCHGQSTNHLI